MQFVSTYTGTCSYLLQLTSFLIYPEKCSLQAQVQASDVGALLASMTTQRCLFTVCCWLSGSVRVTSVGEMTVVLYFRER